MTPDDPYQFHSSYPVWQIETVSAALEKAGVDYQVSFDDTVIKKMDPVTAMMGGTYGDGAQAKVFVNQDQIEKANETLKEFLTEGTETEHPGSSWFRSHFGTPPSDQGSS